MMTPDMTRAFRLLDVAPGADRATIRKAWRKLVRAYHPDQVRGDKVAANRRLADLNAAFDLVSTWDPSMVEPAAPPRPTRRRKARQQAQSAQRRKDEAAARARAATLEARDAAKRAARAAAAERATRPVPPSSAKDRLASRAARRVFSDALRVLGPAASPELSITA
ncbi:J domain-containing protein [Hasllibacter sp. MH4015]|uniref:J domain-containing protein n=1 Tax=Hasllibacter sp. MH4015 TaxID=2854029 RepID=UPI001CD3C22A|nr:J domain-containing protein [Hasllibacter sp. MH4015]